MYDRIAPVTYRIEDDDVLAKRRPDGQYDIVQRNRGRDVFIEGPYERRKAEVRAQIVAAQAQADAWIEEVNGTATPLA